MKTYTYDEARKLEYVVFAEMGAIINQITVHKAKQLHFHEYDHENIGVRILDEDGNEIAAFGFDREFNIAIDREGGFVKLV